MALPPRNPFKDSVVGQTMEPVIRQQQQQEDEQRAAENAKRLEQFNAEGRPHYIAPDTKLVTPKVSDADWQAEQQAKASEEQQRKAARVAKEQQRQANVVNERQWAAEGRPYTTDANGAIFAKHDDKTWAALKQARHQEGVGKALADSEKQRRQPLQQEIQGLDLELNANPERKTMSVEERRAAEKQVKDAAAAARNALISHLDPVASQTTGGFMGFGAAPTSEAVAARDKLTRISDPTTALGDDDLQLAAQVAPAAHEKIVSLQAALKADDERKAWRKDSASKLYDLKLRHDNPVKWEQDQLAKAATLPPEQATALIQGLHDDLAQHRDRIDQEHAAITTAEQGFQSAKESLVAANAEKRRTGIPADRAVTLANGETWDSELLAQYHGAEDEHAKWSNDNAPRLTALKARIDEFNTRAKRIQQTGESISQRKMAQQEAEQSAQWARLDSADPGTSTALRSIMEEAKVRAADLADMYPEGGTQAEEALAALNEDVQSKQRAALAAHDERQRAGSNLYNELTKFNDGIDWADSTDPVARQMVENKAAKLGLSPEQAAAAIKLNRERDWSKPLPGESREADLRGMEPLGRTLGDVSGQGSTGAVTAPTRLTSDGLLLVNPSLALDRKGYEEAVSKAQATPEQKQAALERRAGIAQNAALNLLPMLDAGTLPAGISTAWEDFQAKQGKANPLFKHYTPAQKAQQFLESQDKPSLLKNLLVSTGMGAAQGLLGIGGTVYSLGGMLGSESMRNVAQSIDGLSQSMGQQLQTQRFNERTGMQTVTALTNSATQMLPTLGMGAVGAQAANWGARLATAVKGAKDAGGLLKALAATEKVVASSAVQSLAARAAGGLGEGIQSMGQLYNEAYRTYREQGMTDQQAHHEARKPALASLLTTAVIGFLGGASGAEVMFRNEAKAGILKGFTNAVKHIGGTALREMPKEALEEFGQTALDELTSKLTFEPGKSVSEMLGNALEAGWMGALLGGGFSAATAAADVYGAPPAEPMHQRPEMIAAAQQGIREMNFTAPAEVLPQMRVLADDGQGGQVVDMAATNQRAQTAAFALLDIAQGARLQELPIEDLQALGLERSGDKVKPVAGGKDGALPLIEVDGAGNAIITQPALDWLGNAAPAVRAAIGMDERAARAYFAQQAKAQANSPKTASALPADDAARGTSGTAAAAPTDNGVGSAVSTGAGAGGASSASAAPALNDAKAVRTQEMGRYLESLGLSAADAATTAKALVAKRGIVGDTYLEHVVSKDFAADLRAMGFTGGLDARYAKDNPLVAPKGGLKTAQRSSPETASQPMASTTPARDTLGRTFHTAARATVMKYTGAARDRVAKALNAAGQTIAAHHAAYGAIIVGNEARQRLDGAVASVDIIHGKVTLLLDTEALAAQFGSLANPENAVRAVIREELKHALSLHLERSGDARFSQEAKRGYWRNLPAAVKAQVWQSYHALGITDGTVSKDVPAKLSGAQERAMAEEFIRMLSQNEDFQGSITESVDPDSTLLGWIRDLIKALGDKLREFLKGATGQTKTDLEYVLRQLIKAEDHFTQASKGKAATVLDPYLPTAQQLVTSLNRTDSAFSDASLIAAFDALPQAVKSALATAPGKHSKVKLMSDYLATMASHPEMAREVGMGLVDAGNKRSLGIFATLMNRVRALLGDPVAAQRLMPDAVAQTVLALHARTLAAYETMRAGLLVVDSPDIAALQTGTVDTLRSAAEESAQAMLEAWAAFEAERAVNTTPAAREALRERLTAQEKAFPVMETAAPPAAIDPEQTAAASAQRMMEAMRERDLAAMQNASPEARVIIARRLAVMEQVAAQMHKASAREIAQALRDGKITATQAELAGVMVRIATGDFEGRGVGFYGSAGWTVQRQLAQLGIGIVNRNPFTRPGKHAAYVEQRHIILRQEALDRLAAVLPITRNLINLTEAEARQYFNLPAKPSPQMRDDVLDTPPREVDKAPPAEETTPNATAIKPREPKTIDEKLDAALRMFRGGKTADEKRDEPTYLRDWAMTNLGLSEPVASAMAAQHLELKGLRAVEEARAFFRAKPNAFESQKPPADPTPPEAPPGMGNNVEDQLAEAADKMLDRKPRVRRDPARPALTKVLGKVPNASTGDTSKNNILEALLRSPIAMPPKAQRKGKGEWDWMETSPLFTDKGLFWWRSKLFRVDASAGKKGDLEEQLNALARDGHLPDSIEGNRSGSELSDAIMTAIGQVEAIIKGDPVTAQDVESERMAEMEQQTVKFERDTESGPIGIEPASLRPGEVLVVKDDKGEPHRLVVQSLNTVPVDPGDFDPNGNPLHFMQAGQPVELLSVSMQDGPTYGLQHVSAGQVIYVDGVGAKDEGGQPLAAAKRRVQGTAPQEEALRVYRQLTGLEAKGQKLSITQQQAKERAERAMGQTFMALAAEGSYAPAEDLRLEGQFLPSTAAPEPVREEQMALFAAKRRAVEPGFYSKLEETVAAKMPNRADAATIKGIVGNPQNGIKPEELKWTGLVPWLEAQDGPVTKQAVLDYLANEGAVRFEEVSHSTQDTQSRNWTLEESTRAAELTRRINNGRATAEEEAELDRLHETLESRRQIKNYSAPPKYASYQLPGGENYREVVLALPPGKVMDVIARDLGYSGWDSSLTPEDKAKIVAVFERQRVKPGESYTSSHFQNVDNYVAHYRANDRTDAQGQPGTLLEELQSDRHQAGREKGYKETITTYVVRNTKSGNTSPVFDTRAAAVEYMGNLPGSYSLEIVPKSREIGAIPDAPFRTAWPLQLFKRALHEAVQSGKQWIGWTTGDTQAERYDLSKQVSEIRHSKDSDGYWLHVYDMVGKTITEMNRLTPADLESYVGKEVAKKIIAREGVPVPGEGYEFFRNRGPMVGTVLKDRSWFIQWKNGETSGTYLSSEDARREGQRITDDYVLRDPADEPRTLTGEGLKVGGDGMKGFYDSILPKEIGKYVKQWGAGVVKGELNEVPFRDWLQKVYGKDSDVTPLLNNSELKQGWQRANPSTPIWRVDITPAMAASVREGQALFASKRSSTNDPAQQDLFAMPTTPPLPAAKLDLWKWASGGDAMELPGLETTGLELFDPGAAQRYTAPRYDLPGSPRLESDRPRTNAGDGGGTAGLPLERGATGEAGRPLDATGDAGGDTRDRGPLSADVPAAPPGSASPGPVREPAPDLPQRTPRDAGRGRSDLFDDGGLSPDIPGSSDVGESLIIAGSPGPLAPSSTTGNAGLAPARADGWSSPLTPEQLGDVAFIERRLLNEGKPGVLLTNGTGTGKTFSGMGAVKAALDRGAKHILIVAPSDKVGSDWVRTAKDFFDVPDAGQLGGITDNGGSNRIAVTTYANLGQNPALVQREWDMVVTDEAHYLSSSQQGTATNALNALRALTWHKNGMWRRAEMLHPEEAATAAEISAIDFRQRRTSQQEELDRVSKIIDATRDRLRTEQKAMPFGLRPKVLMLSASPFAYHFSLDYAEGYLFDHGEEPESRGYNTPSARDRFYVENFGYRMRYGKLTQPENATATGILERRFAQRLMKEGAMSGRALEVPFDYSRQFVMTESALGAKIDHILDVMHKSPRLSVLSKELGIGDYLARRYLLEALKARESVTRIRQHLAMGRKVVVFHDYKKGGALNPLDASFAPGAVGSYYDAEQSRHVEIPLAQALQELKSAVPEFDDIQRELNGLLSPIEIIQREFPEDAAIFNGSESKQARRQVVDYFNQSGGRVNVLLVQRASGKEGISLHDRDARHQRVFMDLGIPGRPTDAIQGEGRIYRHGVQSNAILEYLTTGTNFERWTFAQTIAQRASTAENLAMGERARALLQAFASGYNDAEVIAPNAAQGTGGKAGDRARDMGDPFTEAVALYYTNQKKTSRNKAAEGTDYYATPEPLGYKMVEWADIRPGDKVLEPSAGHGAIARFFPDSTNRHAVEPSNELAGRLALNATDTEIHQTSFENYHIGNKFDAVVMNPPFGTAGKTAMEHLIKATGHLREGGRVVALIPVGAMNRRFSEWYESPEAQGFVMRAEVLLPAVTFERAGTGVSTRVVVLDKITPTVKKEGRVWQDIELNTGLVQAQDVKELFDRLQNMTVPPRPEPTRDIEEASSTEDSERFDKPLNTTASIPQPSQEGTWSPAQTKHSKTGADLFVARIMRRLSTDEYASAKEAAKLLNGWYSSYKADGAIPGFQFKSAEARDAFIGARESTGLKAAKRSSQPWPTPAKTRTLMTAVDVSTLNDGLRSAVYTGLQGLEKAWGIAVPDRGSKLAVTARPDNQSPVGKSDLGPLGGEVNQARVSSLVARFRADDAGEQSSPILKDSIDTAAHEAATSPRNHLPEPTQAQKEAGNYKKGHVRIGGVPISIENPEGSVRRGTDASGKAWATPMHAHYGYVLNSEGKDGDHVDVFVKPGTAGDWNGPVFIIDQRNPGTGKFDEHKAVIGVADADEARALYLSNYTPGWQGLGKVTHMPWTVFKRWSVSPMAKKPAARTPHPTEHTTPERMATAELGAESIRLAAAKRSSGGLDLPGLETVGLGLFEQTAPQAPQPPTDEQLAAIVAQFKTAIAPLEEEQRLLREKVAKAKQKFQSTTAEQRMNELAREIHAIYKSSGAETAQAEINVRSGARNRARREAQESATKAALQNLNNSDALPHYPLADAAVASHQWWAGVPASKPPNAWQRKLMDAVATSTPEGEFVTNRQLDARVIPLMGDAFRSQDLSLRADTEGGVVGYEIYNARQAVESERKIAAHKATAAKLVGLRVLKNVTIDGVKFATVTLGDTARPNGTFEFNGVDRQGRKYQGWITPERVAELVSPPKPPAVSAPSDPNQGALFAAPRPTNPLASAGFNHLDRALTDKMAALTASPIASAGDAAAKWLNAPNAKPFVDFAKLLQREFIPGSVLPREVTAAMREMRIKAALGGQRALDLHRALTGSPKFSDISYPAEFVANPMWREKLYDAMEGRVAMDTLPPAMQALGARLREMLVEIGRDAVKAGRMSLDTFNGLQANYMPRFTRDEAEAMAGNVFKKFKLGTRDLLQQRSTAWHIVDTTAKDPRTGEFVTVAYDDAGRKWRFRDEQHRDAWYLDFTQRQAVQMLRENGRQVTDLLAALDSQQRKEVRAEIMRLTPDQANRPAELSTALAGILKRAIQIQRQRFERVAPYEPDALIKDPVYSIARYAAQMAHDNATAEFFNFVDKHSDWVRTVPTTGFQLIPDNPRFGRLANKYVADDIARQITELVEVPSDAMKVYDTILGWWKTGKTVLNPGTHVRNVLGNLFFSQLAGSNVMNPGNAGFYKDAIGAIRNGGPVLQEAYAKGVLGADFVSAELRQNLRELLPDPATIEDGDPSLLLNIGKTLGKLIPKWASRPVSGTYNKIAALYSVEDEVFKLAAWLKAQSMGMTADQAADHVRKWFPYFDKGTSSTLKLIGRTAMPFLGFYRESARIFSHALRERPLALATGLALPSLITLLSAMALGLSRKDEEEVKKDMRGRGGKLLGPTPLADMPIFSMLLPTRTATGDLQQLDISAIHPFTDFLGTKVESRGGDWWQDTVRSLVAAGPIASILYQQMTGRDAFGDRPFIAPDMTGGEKLTARVSSAATTLLPPLTPFVGTGYKTLESAGTRSTNKTLEERDPMQAFARAVVGVDVRNANPDIYRLANDFRRAKGMEVDEAGGGAFPSTDVSRARSALFAELAQTKPDRAALVRTLAFLKTKGVPVSTAQDLNRLLFYRDPLKVIGGDRAQGISAKDAQAQFMASLTGESRRVLVEAVKEFNAIAARAPSALTQARAAVR